jgi:hypothetical protein
MRIAFTSTVPPVARQLSLPFRVLRREVVAGRDQYAHILFNTEYTEVDFQRDFAAGYITLED